MKLFGKFILVWLTLCVCLVVSACQPAAVETPQVPDVTDNGEVDADVPTDTDEVVIDGAQVSVAGCTMSLEQPEQIDEKVLQQLIYRSVSFYRSVMTKDFAAVEKYATYRLWDAMDMVAANEETGNELGEQTILQLDNYIDNVDPTDIAIAEYGTDGDYQVLLTVGNGASLQFLFQMSEGEPYIASMQLIME